MVLTDLLVLEELLSFLFPLLLVEDCLLRSWWHGTIVLLALGLILLGGLSSLLGPLIVELLLLWIRLPFALAAIKVLADWLPLAALEVLAEHLNLLLMVLMVLIQSSYSRKISGTINNQMNRSFVNNNF